MTDEPKIIYNAIQTPDGTIIESRHVHDCQFHRDKNGEQYMVDGGQDYLRRGGPSDYVELSLDSTAPHETQRELLSWGSYGPQGDQPLKHIPIKDMETRHIQLVLEECNPAQHLSVCMWRELKLRKEQDNAK